MRKHVVECKRVDLDPGVPGFDRTGYRMRAVMRRVPGPMDGVPDVNCRVEVRASDASVCKVEIDYVNGNSRCFRRYRIEPETKNQRGHYDFVTHVVSCSWTFDPSFYCEVGFALVNSYRVFEKGRNLMSKSPAPRAP